MPLRIVVIFILCISIIQAAQSQNTQPAKPGANMPPAQTQGALTPAQLAKMKEILSAYKPNSLSVDDAKAIKRNLREAGIQPGSARGDALRAAGFDPKKLEALDPRPAGAAPGGERTNSPPNAPKPGSPTAK